MHLIMFLTARDCAKEDGLFLRVAMAVGPCLAWTPMNNIVCGKEIKNAGL